MIYISLTTVPERMEFERSCRENLESLLNQKTNRDFKVLYNVPYVYVEKQVDYDVPEWIYDLALENPKLIINRLEDFGPVTKVVGVVKHTQDPNDILIICDDDQLYHEDMLEYHIRKLEEYKKSPIAFRGDRLHERRTWTEEDGTKKYLFVSLADTFPIKMDMNITIPGHWHSVSYYRWMFEDDFLDRDFLLRNWADDIILSYYMAKKGHEYVCASWDKETDFRPVNYHGRNSNHFPVVQNLPFESHSGCFVFRNRTGTRVNDQVTYPQEWVDFIIDYYSTGKIYIQHD